MDLLEGRNFQSMTEAVVGADVAQLDIGDHFAPVHGQGAVIDEEEATHTGLRYESA